MPVSTSMFMSMARPKSSRSEKGDRVFLETTNVEGSDDEAEAGNDTVHGESNLILSCRDFTRQTHLIRPWNHQTLEVLYSLPPPITRRVVRIHVIQMTSKEPQPANGGDSIPCRPRQIIVPFSPPPHPQRLQKLSHSESRPPTPLTLTPTLTMEIPRSGREMWI